MKKIDNMKKNINKDEDVNDNLRELSAERFKQLVFEFLTSKDANSSSKYILGLHIKLYAVKKVNTVIT